MIHAVKEWMLSIIMLAFLISLLRVLLPEGSLRKVGAFTGSLVLMAAILRPLVRLEPEWPVWDMEPYEAAVSERMEELNAAAEERFRLQVAERSAELIREKAAELGTSLSVEVTVRMEDGVPLPWTVTLGGAWDGELSAWLKNTLDIPPERQYWADSKN